MGKNRRNIMNFDDKLYVTLRKLHTAPLRPSGGDLRFSTGGPACQICSRPRRTAIVTA